YPVAYSPDSRWIASGSWDGSVRLWDAATGEPVSPPLRVGSIVRALAFSPDGTWLVTGGDDDRLRIWDVATAQVRREVPGPRNSVRWLTVSPDAARIAAAGYGGEERGYVLNVTEVATGKEVFAGKGTAYAFSPDGRWLAGRTDDEKSLVLWD